MTKRRGNPHSKLNRPPLTARQKESQKLKAASAALKAQLASGLNSRAPRHWSDGPPTQHLALRTVEDVDEALEKYVRGSFAPRRAYHVASIIVDPSLHAREKDVMEIAKRCKRLIRLDVYAQSLSKLIKENHSFHVPSPLWSLTTLQIFAPKGVDPPSEDPYLIPALLMMPHLRALLIEPYITPPQGHALKSGPPFHLIFIQLNNTKLMGTFFLWVTQNSQDSLQSIILDPTPPPDVLDTILDERGATIRLLSLNSGGATCRNLHQRRIREKCPVLEEFFIGFEAAASLVEDLPLVHHFGCRPSANGDLWKRNGQRWAKVHPFRVMSVYGSDVLARRDEILGRGMQDTVPSSLFEGEDPLTESLFAIVQFMNGKQALAETHGPAMVNFKEPTNPDQPLAFPFVSSFKWTHDFSLKLTFSCSDAVLSSTSLRL